LAGRSVIVSNRQNLTAIDLVTGRHRWIQEFDETHGVTPAWYWVPMRPLITADRVYARRISKIAMPQLVCLDLASGRVRWTSSPDNYVVSQPFQRHDSLLALTVPTAEPLRASAALRARRPKSKTPDLHLTAFDPRDGTVLYQRSLVRLRDRWYGMIPCRMTTVGNDLLVTVGGAMLCADLNGDIRWLRKQPLAAGAGPLQIRNQYHGPPLVVEDRVFAFQPGALAIECLDLETGRIVWQRALPGITRLVGRADDRLIVQLNAKYIGLETKDGSTVWQHEPASLNQALLCGGPGGFAFVDYSSVDVGTWRLDLVWLDPQSGDVVARHFLSEIYRRGRVLTAPQCGPFLRVGERTFIGMPENRSQPKARDLFELVVATDLQ
jgi:outer membrane protein assembly factor BamB